MSTLLRPARPQDRDPLHRLAVSLAARGFLTLPMTAEGMEELIALSGLSFAGRVAGADAGRYLFVLEVDGHVVGSSLIVARHGTPESPHFFFRVDRGHDRLDLVSETTGRTELGGLILVPEVRGHAKHLGKRLSFVRLLYIGRHRDRFREALIAELLPPFTPEGRSPFWEAVGRRSCGLDYQEADKLSRTDKGFVGRCLPQGPIVISSLPESARAILGVPGPETRPVVRILEEVGFRCLDEIDPFDGGPHYGADRDEVRYDVVEALLGDGAVRVEIPD